MILKTIFQIKNLIIGNNKYKSFILNRSIQSHLFSLLQNSDDNYNNDQKEILKQILIIFTSFSSGHLCHVYKLINDYHLHETLFKLLKQFKQTSKDNIELIELILKCFNNLYKTAQLNHYLISKINNECLMITTKKNGLNYLFDLINLSPKARQSVVDIYSIVVTYAPRKFASLIYYETDEATKDNKQ
jgi:hypothetical protein